MIFLLYLFISEVCGEIVQIILDHVTLDISQTKTQVSIGQLTLECIFHENSSQKKFHKEKCFVYMQQSMCGLEAFQNT